MRDARDAVNMSCARCSELLDAYLDGELTSAEEQAVRQHARACPSCAQEMDRAVACRSLLRSAEALSPRPGFRSALLTQVREEQARRERRSRMFRILAPTLGPALAAALAIGLMLPRSADVQRVPELPPPRVAGAQPDEPAITGPMAAQTTPAESVGVADALAPRPSPHPRRPLVARPAAMASAQRERSETPSYLTARLSAGPVRTQTSEAPQPIILSEVPEPEAVFVASAATTYSL